jgi:hypothetical protein
MKTYTYEEWKILLNLDEKDHVCQKCNGSGGIDCKKCNGYGVVGSDNGEDEPCAYCNDGKVVCPECNGDCHTLKLAYTRARNMETARIRRWGVE